MAIKLNLYGMLYEKNSAANRIDNVPLGEWDAHFEGFFHKEAAK
jgi:hypothetical protein